MTVHLYTLPKHRGTRTHCHQPCPCRARRTPPRLSQPPPAGHSRDSGPAPARLPPALPVPGSARRPSQSARPGAGAATGAARSAAAAAARPPPSGRPPAPQLTALEWRIVELHREAAAVRAGRAPGPSAEGSGRAALGPREAARNAGPKNSAAPGREPPLSAAPRRRRGGSASAPRRSGASRVRPGRRRPALAGPGGSACGSVRRGARGSERPRLQIEEILSGERC